MSELDLLKEKIAYLKVLIGIFVVTAISLIGWMASNFVAATIWMKSASIFAMMVLLLVIFGLHRRIERLIDQLRDV
jgi:hypothetical protein